MSDISFICQEESMKKTTLLLTLLSLIALLAVWLWGRPLHRHFKESRALARAQRFLTNDDYANASLSARQVLHLNPTNLEACKIMARLADLAGIPEALHWRGLIAQLSPTLESKLSLASTAIRLEAIPCSTAAETLATLKLSAKHSCVYHVLSAELALKLNKPDDAERHFVEACRLEPTNQLHQLNLAVLRLRSSGRTAAHHQTSNGFGSVSSPPEKIVSPSLDSPTDGLENSEPRAVLARFQTHSNFAVVALRSLLTDALLRKELPAAEHYSTQLLSQPQVALQDQLQHLNILNLEANSQFQPFLKSMQDSAMASPHMIYSIASWMTAHGLADAALNWLTNLPPKLQSTIPVPLAMGDAFVAQRNWPGLEDLIAAKNWDQFDFVRSAWLSRTAWEQRRTQAAEAHWRMAIRQAGRRLESLTWLAAMSRQSGQPPDQVLWRIVHQFPKEDWAWMQLQEFLAAAQDTSGLNVLYSEWITFQPKNLIAKNNFAATSMLLKRNLAKAHEAARELYLQNRDDPVIVSTYAYSLHLQGRTREGLAALEKCSTTALQSPAVALYYGVLLEADGQTHQATRFLALAKSSDALLPEEQQLAIGAK
jgi:hypothetical protein